MTEVGEIIAFRKLISKKVFTLRKGKASIRTLNFKKDSTKQGVLISKKKPPPAKKVKEK